MTAFEDFFRDNYARAYYLALRITQDEDASRDIVSSSFEALLMQVRRGAARNMQPYLFATVRNQCLDHLRRKKVREQYVRMRMAMGDADTAAADAAVVRIEPGEDAALSGGRLSVRDVNVDDFTCWRDGIVYFDHEQLRNILTELGSWYNVNVICRDKALLGRHYHYVFNRNAALEEALQLLNDVSDAEVRLENGTIFID